MKSLSCMDAGCDCDYFATGQTEEELMGRLKEHWMKEYGKTEEDMMQMRDKLKNYIGLNEAYKDDQIMIITVNA